MNQNTKKLVDLIEALNIAKIPILEIYDPDNRESTLRYYKTGNFRPSEGNTHYHSLISCIDITEIINERSSLFANDTHFIQSVITEIEKKTNYGQTVTRDYSSQFRWVWYK